VLTQIGAVQAALDKVALALLDDHTKSCLVERRGSRRAPPEHQRFQGAVPRFEGLMMPPLTVPTVDCDRTGTSLRTPIDTSGGALPRTVGER
jgi:Metal-sensitive transcriptional repressor